MRDIPIVVPVAVGVLVYCGCCLLLRAVAVDDPRRFWSYFLERRAAQVASPG